MDTKIWLAYFKLNHEGKKASYLDWLTEFIQKQKLDSLSKILDIPIDRAQVTGTYQYRLTLDVVSAGIVYAEGTLRVEKLTAPRWPGKGVISYDFGAVALGKPRLPSQGQIFDLVITTPQEWGADDFEGRLWLTNLTASAGVSVAHAGATISGGFLNSKNGMSIALEDGGVFLGTGIPRDTKEKPKITLAAEALVGPVSRSNPGLLDMSRPFVASATVTGNLKRRPTSVSAARYLLRPPGSCCVSSAPISWQRSTARLARLSSSGIPTAPTPISAMMSCQDFERTTSGERFSIFLDQN